MHPREKEKHKSDSQRVSSNSGGNSEAASSPRASAKDSHEFYEKESEKSVRKIQLTAQLFGNQERPNEMNHVKFMNLRNTFFTQYRFLLLLNKLANENVATSDKIEALLSGLTLLDEEAKQTDIVANKNDHAIVKKGYRHSILCRKEIAKIRSALIAAICKDIDIYINEMPLSKAEILKIAENSKRAYVFIKNMVIDNNTTSVPTLFYVAHGKITELNIASNQENGMDSNKIWLALHDATNDIGKKDKKVNPESVKLENIWNIVTQINGHTYGHLGEEYIDFSVIAIREKLETFQELQDKLEKHSIFYAENHTKFSATAESLQLYIHRSNSLPLEIKNLDDRTKILVNSIEQEIIDRKNQIEHSLSILDNLKKEKETAEKNNNTNKVETIKKEIDKETAKYNNTASRLKTITQENYLNEQIALEKQYHHDKNSLLKHSLSTSGVKLKVKLNDLIVINTFPYDNYQVDNNSLLKLIIKPQYQVECGLTAKIPDRAENDYISKKSAKAQSYDEFSQKKKGENEWQTSASHITSTSSSASTSSMPSLTSGAQRINMSRPRAMAVTSIKPLSIKPLSLAASSSPILEKSKIAHHDAHSSPRPNISLSSSSQPSSLDIVKEVEKEKSSEDNSSNPNSPKTQDLSSEPSEEATESSEGKVTVQHGRERLHSNPVAKRRNSENAKEQSDAPFTRMRRNSLPITLHNTRTEDNTAINNDHDEETATQKNNGKNQENRILRRSERFNKNSIAGYNLHTHTSNNLAQTTETDVALPPSPRVALPPSPRSSSFAASLFSTAPASTTALVRPRNTSYYERLIEDRRHSEPKSKPSPEAILIAHSTSTTHSTSLPASPTLSSAVATHGETTVAKEDTQASTSLTGISMYNNHGGHRRPLARTSAIVTSPRRKAHTESDLSTAQQADNKQTISEKSGHPQKN